MPGFGTLASKHGVEEQAYDASRPMPALEFIYNHPIPNIPGKSMVGLKITFPPNAATPPHSHPGAFLAVTVLSGSVLNKMNKDPLMLFKPGEAFFEYPGCHHAVSANHSQTEEAVILATIITDTEKVKSGKMEDLILIDEEHRVRT